MVCDSLKNTIPKAVVYCQVLEAKRALLNRFYAQVGRKEVIYDKTIHRLLACQSIIIIFYFTWCFYKASKEAFSSISFGFSDPAYPVTINRRGTINNVHLNNATKYI